mmetsp:Transcript_16021/g.47544  ORF Transcript_16021/g.47544 Transcript_16021/m.47544 type:complete len:378 (-) Transcript_16021:455-1588(-)
MTASVPSKQALATSVISARVGRGLLIIDSSICVAVTMNLPAMLALVIIIFCASGTFSTGISMPRSPRATMMPSVTSRISSKLSSPAAFSILEMILTWWPPASSSTRRMNSTSALLCTNDAATKSILCLAAKFCRSLMSFSVSTGMSTLTPGRLQFLRSPSILLLSTVPRSSVSDRISSTVMLMEPSASRILLPAFTSRHRCAYESPMRVSLSSLKPSNSVYRSPTASTMIVWPASRSIGFASRSMAVRTSGPFVSSSAAAQNPVASQTFRKRSSTLKWPSWSPCEKLNRSTLSPARRSFSSWSSSQQAGPAVQMILVLRTKWSCSLSTMPSVVLVARSECTSGDSAGGRTSSIVYSGVHSRMSFCFSATSSASSGDR